MHHIFTQCPQAAHMGALPLLGFQLSGRFLFRNYILLALELEVGCEVLLHLEVLIFHFNPEICPMMPILELRLKFSGKQVINQPSTCASAYSLIPSANGECILGVQVSSRGKVPATPSFLCLPESPAGCAAPGTGRIRGWATGNGFNEERR